MFFLDMIEQLREEI